MRFGIVFMRSMRLIFKSFLYNNKYKTLTVRGTNILHKGSMFVKEFVMDHTANEVRCSAYPNCPIG